jgi:hypothetical protein
MNTKNLAFIEKISAEFCKAGLFWQTLTSTKYFVPKNSPYKIPPNEYLSD